MNLQSRIESLKERHASLETRIADEDQRPAARQRRAERDSSSRSCG